MVGVVLVDFGARWGRDDVFEIQRVEAEIFFQIQNIRIIGIGDVDPLEIFGMDDFEGQVFVSTPTKCEFDRIANCTLCLY